MLGENFFRFEKERNREKIRASFVVIFLGSFWKQNAELL